VYTHAVLKYDTSKEANNTLGVIRPMQEMIRIGEDVHLDVGERGR